MWTSFDVDFFPSIEQLSKTAERGTNTRAGLSRRVPCETALMFVRRRRSREDCFGHG